MRTYKLTISYDGTDYSGWQEQPERSTIEGLFKQRLRGLFNHDLSFTGASRTDAGVHALGQVARVVHDLPLSQDEFLHIINHALPQAIRVRSVELVADEFHPRVNVALKTYYYHLFMDDPSPFMSRFGVHMKHMNLDRFIQALELFQGIHDFRSFCTGDQGRTTQREIRSITYTQHPQLGVHRVEIVGPSFLRHMIRRILGACFDVACKQKPLALIEQALEQKNPEQHFFVAPPQGLLLHSIEYTS